MLTHWARALGSLASNSFRDVSAPRRRGFEFTRRWLSFGLEYDRRPRARQAPFLDIYPNADGVGVALGDVAYRRSNANAFEIYCLSCIARLKDARRIFEIGTFDGATTLQLARTCPQSQVFTLDLPPDFPADFRASPVKDEVENVQSGGVGRRFAGAPEAARIVQLYGDSRRFDYTPWQGTIDLVFVDACHEYEFALADSHTALKLLAPHGVVVWHDYEPGWPGVVRAVDSLLRDYPIVCIDKTALAVMDSDWSPPGGAGALRRRFRFGNE